MKDHVTSIAEDPRDLLSRLLSEGAQRMLAEAAIDAEVNNKSGLKALQ